MRWVGRPSLNCSHNELVSLDVSNSELWSLNCSHNHLEELDITPHKITLLQCQYNQLTSLDLSNQKFTAIDCSHNQLSTLIINGMSAMDMYCGDNQLTSLDLNSAKAIGGLSGVLSCENNLLTTLDVSNNTSLKELDCKSNSLTVLDTSGCPNLEIFEYDGNTKVITLQPEFKAHQPVLEGQIIVNFFALLPQISGVDYSKSYVKFDVLNDTTYNPVQEYDPSFTTNGKSGTYYGFRCCLTSIQMADPITATLHYGNGKTITHTYKLTDYLDKYYNDTSKSEALRNIVGAMKDYGHYAQIALAEVNGWTLGTTHFATEAAKGYTDSDIE